MSKSLMKNIDTIETKIFTVRGTQVMFDRDLAILFDVETRVLNQAVNRNIDWFPEEFCFKLNKDEFEYWKSQIVISNSDKMGLRKPPSVFTEHDRFLILDNKDLYHIGASLKDLGNKIFGFSKMDKEAIALLAKIKEVGDVE